MPAKNKYRTGLVSISFRKLHAADIIKEVAEAGLEGIEWGGDVHVPHGDLETAGRVGKQTTEAGLEVAAYGSYYRFDDIDPDAEEAGPAPNAVLDTAQALGTSMIRLWAGRKSSREAASGWVRSVADRAREIAIEAEKRGLRLGFEFHENSLTDTPESTLELLNAIGHPSVTTFWQGYLQTSPADRRRSLKSVLPFVSNIHVNYFGQEPWPNAQPLADGGEEWKDYLKLLDETNRSHWLTIEHVKDHEIEQFKADAQTLKKWSGHQYSP